MRTNTGGIGRVHKPSVALGILPSIDAPETVTLLNCGDTIMLVNDAFEALASHGIVSPRDVFVQGSPDLGGAANGSVLIARRAGFSAVAAGQREMMHREAGAMAS